MLYQICLFSRRVDLWKEETSQLLNRWVRLGMGGLGFSKSKWACGAAVGHIISTQIPTKDYYKEGLYFSQLFNLVILNWNFTWKCE